MILGINGVNKKALYFSDCSPGELEIGNENLETTIEQEKPLLGDYGASNISSQVAVFTTIDERECPVVSSNVKLRTGKKIRKKDRF